MIQSVNKARVGKTTSLPSSSYIKMEATKREKKVLEMVLMYEAFSRELIEIKYDKFASKEVARDVEVSFCRKFKLRHVIVLSQK